MIPVATPDVAHMEVQDKDQLKGKRGDKLSRLLSCVVLQPIYRGAENQKFTVGVALPQVF